ncbi:phage tail tape measure protein [Mycobacterium malmoense]|uniref:phage tail tape measure protein n=1 Tax=Mycobacterium malmoense TaxID=1780 RepID=UPI0008F81465|nr:phage tail tape measure protein [Mycobacterium malmoense]OIN79100.1 phage tail tape measure protein [Mycobacterium malmoense]
MPVYLDVEIRGAQAAAAAAAREITSVFEGVGRGINRGLSGALSEGLKSFSTAGAVREIEALQTRLVEAGQAEFLLAQKAEAASVRSVASWRAAEAAVDKYGAASARAGKATASAIDASAAATVATNRHTKSVDDNKAAHDDLATALAGSTTAISRFHQAATIASAGIVGGFVAAAVDATKAAGDFQVQLVRLETVGGELPRNLKTIHDGLMDLASNTGWNPTELATGMLKVEQAGYRGTEALTVMKAAAQGAAEEGIGLDEAANAVTTTLHDYHLGADQAATVTSKMIEAVRLGKTTFADFTGALHNVEPTASAVGESLNDLLAVMGMLTQSGMHADQASQNLNHALSSLGNIQPKQREMLASLGLDPRQIPQDIHAKGYIGTAQEIRGAVDRRLGPNGNVILDAFENNPASQALEHEQYGKLSPAEQAVADRIMQGQLSQKEFRKSRGGLGVTEAKIVDAWLTTHENNQGFNRVLKSLNTDQLGQLQALQTAVGGQDNARTLLQVTDQNNPEAVKHREEIANAHADPNGDVMEFKRAQQNFNAQWKDLKASIDSLKIEFGEDFLPTATKWVHSLETGVHWMQQHRALVKDLIEDVTVLSGLFLAMKLSNSLISTVKQFKSNLGLTKTASDQVNTSLRESGPAAQSGSAGVKAASAEESAAQDRVKSAVYQANQELRQSGSAAQAGASGVNAAASEEVGAENRVKASAAEANAQMREAGAAAEAGAAGVVAAANTEVGAMNRVMGAASKARSALALVGGAALSMGGDALQANTRANTNPYKVGVIASDAGNMALAGGAVGSIIPGIGTGIGAAIGGVLGGGYGIWDQYFSGDHDVAAPDNPTPDNGPVPVVNQPEPDTSQPTPDLTPPTPESQPETPDTPYAGGGGGGGGGKKHKDTDPLDEDLKRLERLQTEANEIQGRIADDRASNDPARRGEIPWLQRKLDEINHELSGIKGKGGSGGSSSPFMPVKLDDNWLQGGLSSLVRNTIGFLEDLVLGPLEVAAFHGIPNFEGASGKGGKHSRHGKSGRRSHEEGLGAESEAGAPRGLLGTPGAVPGTRGAGQGVIPVFVTNWASGGPGAAGGAGGGAFGGAGFGSGSGGDGFASRATGSGGGGSSSSGLGASSQAGAPGLGASSAVPEDLNTAFPAGAGAASGAGYPGVRVGTEPAHDKQSVARYIYSAAIARGYTPDQATQIVAYSVGESGLNPGISGGVQGDDEVIGLFQEKTAFARGHNRSSVVGNVAAYLDQLEAHRNQAWGPAYGVGRGALASTSVGGPLSYEGAQAWGPLMARAKAYLGGPPPAPSGGGDKAASAHHTFYDQWYGGSSPSRSTVFAPSISGQPPINPLAYGPFRGGDPRAGRPLSDSEILPPEVVAEAQRRGLFGPDGNLKPGAVPSPTAGAPSGSLSNPKSMAPGVKMPQDVAALPGVNMPLPGVRTSPPPPAQSPAADPGLGSLLGAPGYALGGLVKYFATGGPAGTDTIPAWLSPGEFVMNSDATRQYLPYLQNMNKGARFSTGGLVPQYWQGGMDNPAQPSQPAPPPQQPSARGALPNVSGPGTPKAQGSGQSGLKAALPGAQQPGGPPAPGAAAAPLPGPGGAESPGAQKGMSDAPTPGKDVQQPGADLPASPGIGFSGGIIGAAEGAAESGASGLNVMAPGAGSAASAALQVGFQELNRAAAYGAQVGGIAILGLKEALSVNSDSSGGDWGKTIPGRLVEGIAGVRPTQNSAGATQTPMGGNQNAGYADANAGPNIEYHIHGPMTVNANDPMEFHNGMQQFNDSLTTGENRYPMSGSMFTGRS